MNKVSLSSRMTSREPRPQRVRLCLLLATTIPSSLMYLINPLDSQGLCNVKYMSHSKSLNAIHSKPTSPVRPDATSMPLNPLLPRPNTTPRRRRILSRLRRIPDAHGPTPNQPPPLQMLLDLPLHTTLIMFRFPNTPRPISPSSPLKSPKKEGRTEKKIRATNRI